jgi:hypothetical protein
LEAEVAQPGAPSVPRERKPPLVTPAPSRPAEKSLRPIPPPRPPRPLPVGLRYLPIGIGVAVVLVLIVSALNRCAKQAHYAPATVKAVAPAPVVTPPVRPVGNNNRLQLSEDPPPPYLKMKP